MLDSFCLRQTAEDGAGLRVEDTNRTLMYQRQARACGVKGRPTHGPATETGQQLRRLLGSRQVVLNNRTVGMANGEVTAVRMESKTRVAVEVQDDAPLRVGEVPDAGGPDPPVRQQETRVRTESKPG